MTTSLPSAAAAPGAPGASDSPVVVARADLELVDDPINPDWVLEGVPRVRSCAWATSTDLTTQSFVWDCTAGRFRWYFAADETVHVIQGAVTVTDGEGRPVTLEVGDAALFRAGTWSEWHVTDHVRKHAVLRVPVPRPMAYLAKGLGTRTHRLR